MGKLSIILTSLIALLLSFEANARSCGGLFERVELQNEVHLDRVKIGTYNLLNLFIHKGNIRKNTKVHAKPQWATEKLAETIKEENYDIFIAQEVESVQSARLFNRRYLEDQYEVFSTVTNDVRGLYIVFFVKRNLPFHYEVESHASETWFDPVKKTESTLFERDLPVLHIYRTQYDKQPMLTMLGAHFKSKRNRDTENGAKDIESDIRRTAQANRAVQIIQKYQIKYGYEHPILIAGDFNSNHNYRPEFASFYRHAKLRDTIGVNKRVNSIADRASHSYFGDKKITRHSQLDGILVTPILEKFLIDSYVVKYRDEDGSYLGIPRTKEDRKKNPSDHRPITAIFDFTPLVEQ